VTLTDDELRSRARSVRLVLTDVDGVLTDGGVYVSEKGEELKRFSLRDGMGIERLRDAGIQTAFLTRERSGFATARAAKLRLAHAYLGVLDKAAHLSIVESDTGIPAAQTAYVGDDVNDVGIMQAILRAGGLTAAPGDAFETALGAAAFVTRAAAGHGAFREFAEWLLRMRGADPLRGSTLGSDAA